MQQTHVLVLPIGTQRLETRQARLEAASCCFQQRGETKPPRPWWLVQSKCNGRVTLGVSAPWRIIVNKKMRSWVELHDHSLAHVSVAVNGRRKICPYVSMHVCTALSHTDTRTRAHPHTGHIIWIWCLGVTAATQAIGPPCASINNKQWLRIRLL